MCVWCCVCVVCVNLVCGYGVDCCDVVYDG